MAFLHTRNTIWPDGRDKIQPGQVFENKNKLSRVSSYPGVYKYTKIIENIRPPIDEQAGKLYNTINYIFYIQIASGGCLNEPLFGDRRGSHPLSVEDRRCTIIHPSENQRTNAAFPAGNRRAGAVGPVRGNFFRAPPSSYPRVGPIGWRYALFDPHAGG